MCVCVCVCVCVGVWSDGVETTSTEAMLKGQGLREGMGKGQYREKDVTGGGGWRMEVEE